MKKNEIWVRIPKGFHLVGVKTDGDMVIFDPPHLVGAGASGWLAKKYVHRDHSSMLHLLKKYDDEVQSIFQKYGTTC